MNFKRIPVLCFLLIICNLYAQNKSFFYELKYKPNAQKDSLVTKVMVLDVVNLKSTFRSKAEKENDSSWVSSGKVQSISSSLKDNFSVYKDLKQLEIKKYVSQMFQNYFIPIEEKLIWKVQKETKKEKSFNLQKATTNYGGRVWTAWFSQEIPLQEGPYVFNGLPGLITEIYDYENNFHFSLIEIKNLNHSYLYEKQKPLKINWKQYEKLLLDYYSDPTRDISGKNSGSTTHITKWQDEKGNEFVPNFKEMNEKERRKMQENNNPIEKNHQIILN